MRDRLDCYFNLKTGKTLFKGFKESGKKSEKTDKINNSENQFTSYELESVGNYTKEFAQDIKGKRISLIEQEKETSLEH